MRNVRTFSVFVVVILLFAANQIAAGQAWVPLVNQPNPNLGLGNPLLLTDGTVIAHEACGPTWWRLSPDPFGSYVNGTWKRIASLPSGYAPLYFGSAVLPDGRVMMAGGEYNATGGNCQPAWTNQAAIYDPKANKWTAVAPPAGWANIGDAQSVVLPNGTYMQANCCTTESALLNATTLTWTITGAGKYDINDEEGWTLLPDGTVLTVDAYVFQYLAKGKRYEIYHPATGKWRNPGGDTVVQLWDSYPDANHASDELGPGVLRPDGTVFYMGANGAPGEAGHTAIYDYRTKTWMDGRAGFSRRVGCGGRPGSVVAQWQRARPGKPWNLQSGEQIPGMEWDSVFERDLGQHGCAECVFLLWKHAGSADRQCAVDRFRQRVGVPERRKSESGVETANYLGA